MNTLAEAVRHARGNRLDPVTVWWSGKSWYVIDGHHRIAAYRRALDQNNDLRIEGVPVLVFTGTVDEAIREAASLNSRDKLPMSKDDKLERAWKLVCLDGGWTREQIRDATSISVRTVATMREKKAELLQEGAVDLLDLTWKEVKSGTEPRTVDEEWKEKQAIIWQKRLVKTFGKKLAEQPEIAARALELYSQRLPGHLIREWPDQVRTLVEEEPSLLEEPDF